MYSVRRARFLTHRLSLLSLLILVAILPRISHAGQWVDAGGYMGSTNASGNPDPDALLAFCEYQGDLIAGGWFSKIGLAHASKVARYDGDRWYTMGDGFDGTVHAITLFNGELIVAGGMNNSGSEPVSRIARWDGSAWGELGGGSRFGRDRRKLDHLGFASYCRGKFLQNWRRRGR